MKGRAIAVLLVACGFALACADAQAAARRYPPRYERGSYAQYIMRTRNGQPVVSQVYNGYRNNFPPPAWLYYGYPHSGDGSVSPGF